MHCSANNQFVSIVTKLYGHTVHKLHGIVLIVFKTQRFEAAFCLHLQVKPTRLGPTDIACPYLRTMDNVQKHICIDVPSS
jgi:hypothetical protein